MKCNTGELDKALRISAGIGLTVWAVMGGPAWAFVGIIVAGTGLMSFCPAYAIVGLNSGCKRS